MITPVMPVQPLEVKSNPEERSKASGTEFGVVARFCFKLTGLPIPSVVVPILPHSKEGLPTGVLLWGKPN